MTEAIIVGIISGTVTIIGTVVMGLFSSSKMIYRIDQLEKKVEKHNQFIERVYETEKNIATLDKSTSSAHKRIDELAKR